MSRHLKFFARTVLVKNSDVDTAYRSLDRILRNDRITDFARRHMFYEKPHQKRARLSYEKCKRIYDSDMKQKIAFLTRKNRQEPWLR